MPDTCIFQLIISSGRKQAGLPRTKIDGRVTRQLDAVSRARPAVAAAAARSVSASSPARGLLATGVMLGSWGLCLVLHL